MNEFFGTNSLNILIETSMANRHMKLTKMKIKMKRNFLLFLLFFSFGCISASTINIVSLGAKGDGLADNTNIIQQAVDDCSKTSGTVIIPEGTFLTRTIFIKSNVHLYLQAGAILLGDTNIKSYHDAFPNLKGKETPALIFAKEAENIAITGLGIIDGQGGNENFQHGNDSDGGPKRPKIIYFVGCKNVRIENITLQNSAYWTQDYESCDGLMIKGVKVHSISNWNNDGLDIDSKNVVVSDCYIDCDDDALCFKSDTRNTCENITVTNCVLRTNCNAIKFGTSGYAGFKNITVSNCVISKASEDPIRQWTKNVPWLGTTDKTVVSGIALEAVDGGVMDQIAISNIVMSDVQTPIFIRLGDRKRTVTKSISTLKNVIISNIIATSDSKVACSITGIPEGIVDNVFIKDVQFTLLGGGTLANISEPIPECENKYPENRMFGAVLPASGFYVRHAKNIRFENIIVKTLNADARPMFYLDDVNGIDIYNCKINNEKPKVNKVNVTGLITSNKD